MTRSGSVRVTDLMPVGTKHRAVIRQVIGESGRVAMTLDLALRFDYGSIPPWLRAERRVVRGVVGPDLVVLCSPVDLASDRDRITADFTVEPGQTLAFTLQYGIAHKPEPEPLDPTAAITTTESYWRDWIGTFRAPTDWSDAVKRSLITLQALTEAETGGIIAAPTTSLPEVPGGEFNWDYRYTWLRDATFALTAFLNAGYQDEAICLARLAAAHRGRRARAAAHDVPQRRLAAHLAARCALAAGMGSQPAGACRQSRRRPVPARHLRRGARLCCIFASRPGSTTGLGTSRSRPSSSRISRRSGKGRTRASGSSRGPPRYFTHSKVMAWVGIDRYLKLKDIAAPRRRKLEGLRERIASDDLPRRLPCRAQQLCADLR